MLEKIIVLQLDQFFLDLPDTFWSASSAVATIIAALTALALPFVIKWLGEREKRRRLRTSYEEVVAATRAALKCLNWALDEEKKGRLLGSIDLVRVAARAASRAETLRLLANRDDLSDDAVSSCIAAAQSMHQINKAAEHFSNAQVVSRHMNAALALGREAKERITEVIVGEAISLPINDPLPSLPDLQKPRRSASANRIKFETVSVPSGLLPSLRPISARA